jgi:predicted transcriptional regulator
VSDPGPVHAVKLDERGLARLFGELEARIMETIWSLDKATVRDICHHLGENCNYKTIMTVANRLVTKGALERRRCGRAYVYRSVEPRDAFLENVSREMAVGLMEDFGAPAIAGFVDAVNDVAPQHIRVFREQIEVKARQTDGTDFLQCGV